MKRFILVLLSVSLLVFAGCKKSTPTDFGYFDRIDSAAKVAQTNSQDILLIITMVGDDPYSKDFLKDVVCTSKFQKEIASKYAVVCLDFGSETFNKAYVEENASKKAKKQAEYYADLIKYNAVIGTKFNLKVTPAIYLLTKEQYYITQVDNSVKIESVSDFSDLLDVYEPTINDVHQMIGRTTVGTAEDKIKAIDKLYNSTEPNFRLFLKPLTDQVVELDKNNEFGYLSKYLFIEANSKALNYFDMGKAKEAADEYIKITKDDRLSAEDKQKAYYYAAYILNISGVASEFQTILDYLQASIDADPTSNEVEHISSVLNSLQMIADSIQQPQENKQE